MKLERTRLFLSDRTVRSIIRQGLWRAIVLSLLWWILLEGDPEGWWYGGPVIAAATATSLWLAPEVGSFWHPVGLVRFIGFFLWQSLRGGVDVALRALDPWLPLHPQLIEYHLRLPVGPARVMLMNTISLLPGTLSVELHPTLLQVHVLDGRMDTQRSLQHVEAVVAELFAIEIEQ